jgi:hypothetical protein
MIIWVLALTSIPFAPSRSKRVGGIFSVLLGICGTISTGSSVQLTGNGRLHNAPLPVIFADFSQGLQNWFLRICQLPTGPSGVEGKHVVNPPVLMPVAKFIVPDGVDKVDSEIGLVGVSGKVNRFSTRWRPNKKSYLSPWYDYEAFIYDLPPSRPPLFRIGNYL